MSGDHRNKASRSSADKRDIYYRLCKSEGEFISVHRLFDFEAQTAFSLFSFFFA